MTTLGLAAAETEIVTVSHHAMCPFQYLTLAHAAMLPPFGGLPALQRAGHQTTIVTL